MLAKTVLPHFGCHRSSGCVNNLLCNANMLCYANVTPTFNDKYVDNESTTKYTIFQDLPISLNFNVYCFQQTDRYATVCIYDKKFPKLAKISYLTLDLCEKNIYSYSFITLINNIAVEIMIICNYLIST